MDKSGFEDNQDCIYAWSKKGKKVYVEQEGKRGKRENLVAGRRKKEKDLIAPATESAVNSLSVGFRGLVCGKNTRIIVKSKGN
ncbi:MAG: hypothetical protein O4861_20355 [Trichodesmium sp. St16_bin4-tuft]|nr:hypothetical protein [Trichodesmium sp. St16_bin4-tuft]